MMAQRRRDYQLWMVVLCGYVLASICLLFVYENYVRVGTSGRAHLLLQDRDDPRRTQMMTRDQHSSFDQTNSTRSTGAHHLTADRDGTLAGRQGETTEPIQVPTTIANHNSDRMHSCTLPGNETLHTLQAPDLVIAGAQKGGTSAFYFLLKRHPNFSASKKFESHFFDWHFAVPPKDLKNPSFWAKFNATNEDELLCAARKQYIDENFNVDRLLKSSKRKFTYEKTPNYMFLPQVPELIYKVCPWHPKIILILRNPVDRAYSHYVMDSGKDRVEKTFEQYIELEMNTMRRVGLTNIPNLPALEWGSLDRSSPSMDDLFYHPPTNMTQDQLDHAHWMVYRIRHMRNYLQRGIYGVQLERWMKFFPLNEKLLIINNERLHREPRKVMGEVLQFLGAPRPDYYASEEVSVSLTDGEAPSKTRVSNVLSVGGYHPMQNATRLFLEKFYKPYNDQIADLLGEEWRGVWDYDAATTSSTTKMT